MLPVALFLTSLQLPFRSAETFLPPHKLLFFKDTLSISYFLPFFDKNFLKIFQKSIDIYKIISIMKLVMILIFKKGGNDGTKTQQAARYDQRIPYDT